jgi:hypothetical protein
VEVRQGLDAGELDDHLNLIVDAVKDDAGFAASTIVLIPDESMNLSCRMSIVTGPPTGRASRKAAANSRAFAKSSSPVTMKPWPSGVISKVLIRSPIR